MKFFTETSIETKFAVNLSSNQVSQMFPVYRVAQKSKTLPNDQKIVLNRIKTCQWWFYSSN